LFFGVDLYLGGVECISNARLKKGFELEKEPREQREVRR
jgi:hypothetical protein